MTVDDFTHNMLASVRRSRMVRLVDYRTRECLAMDVDT